MAEFRWMAPIFIGITSSPGIRDRDQDSYQSALNKLATSLSEYAATSPRAEAGSHPSGWAKASGAALPWPLEVLQGTYEEPPLTPNSSNAIILRKNINWCLFDYGVFLADGFLQVDDEQLSQPRQLEEQIRQLISKTTRRISKEITTCIRKSSTKISDFDRYFLDDDDDGAEPLWVTRAFQMDTSNFEHEKFASEWISNVDDDNDLEFKRLMSGEDVQVARWMNHVHNAAEHEELNWRWNALKDAQFFWASLQHVDEKLRRILAASMADSREIDLRDVRHTLNDTVNSAVDLIMVQDEYRQCAPRKIKEKVDQFHTVWGYEPDLKKPAQTKLALCQDRIAKLSSEQQERSAVTTDVILLGIGLTSLLATAVALVQFGRDASNDPHQSMFDLGNGNITSWLSSQSMDSVLVISLFASLILMILFFWKRRQGM